VFINQIHRIIQSTSEIGVLFYARNKQSVSVQLDYLSYNKCFDKSLILRNAGTIDESVCKVFFQNRCNLEYF